MSFVGGGSDLREYYGRDHGAVVSTAINKYVYITVNKKFTDQIRLGYSKIEYVDSIDMIEHNLVREALRVVGIKKGIDLVYMSDLLPAHEGSGLGASSALLVGTLNALHAFKGEFASARQLAEEACRIEIDVLGHPIGKQDQYIAAFGGFNYTQFNADESVFVNPLIMRKEVRQNLNRHLMLFYTAINKRSDDILNEQRAKTGSNMAILNEMVDMAKSLRTDLQENRLENFGAMLHKGWLLKQKLASKISNGQIDEYYAKAIQAGAQGGKILGSGGGGFLLFYCEPALQPQVRTALKDLKEVDFELEPEGSKIIYVN